VGTGEAAGAGFAGDPAGQAGAIVAAGAALAVITDGPRPVAAASRTGERWEVLVPPVEALNAVGSGDAFDAGLCLALLGGAPVAAGLAAGVAAGTANAEAFGAGMVDAARVATIRARVVVRPA
jgi:fructose-1-phosphate kinase PfkB-like protein